MTASLKLLVAGLTLVAAGAAHADCAADLARFEAGAATAATEGIAKDGSLAPLQGEASVDTTTQAVTTPEAATTAETTTPGTTATGDGSSGDDNQIAKDGSTAPLESAGDSGADVAMSGQDAQAQQEGRATAAGQAEAESGTDDRATALRDARAALEAGDEAACQEALKRAEAS